jgi:tetratricopeptide (TPR) repeat protein
MFERLFASLVVVAWSAATAGAQPTLDKPAFSAAPKDLLDAAKSVKPGDHAVVILRDEEEITLDEQGRRTWRWRRVFVVRAQAGVDNWGTLGLSWSPFYQDKPTIRARAIDPNGAVTELDQKLITDAPATSESPSVFSDRRDIEAPLPRLRVGTVVEQETLLKDRHAILPGVGMSWATIGRGVPVESTRIVLSAPARRGKLHTLGVAIKPKHAVANGRDTWTFDAGPHAAIDEEDAYLPRDVFDRGLVGISIATWPAIAREYRKLVDKRITDGPFTFPTELPKTATIETVRAITAWLHRHVRYTGIEFGDASNIPWTPAETAKRGFGDCKDKATLLVAMLRHVGIRADLALLSTGPGFDVMKELPGMMFDHAIVRARVGGKDVWIDATEDLLLPGQLPARDQGRRALVIADDTAALVDTPRAPATENLVKETRVFDLSENGAGRFKEVTVEGGVYSGSFRSWYRDARPDEVKKTLTAYVEDEYKGKYARHGTTSAEDLATPFAVTVEGTDTMRAYTDRDKIDVYLFPSAVLAKVPAIAKVKPDAQHPRKADFEWYVPHVSETENRIVLPPGYTMPSIPAERTRQLGAAKLVERHRVDGRTLVVTFRFESGKQRITAAELAAMQKEMGELPENVHIVIEHTGRALAQRGKLREAIVEIEKLVALHPKEAVHHTQLAFVLVEAGMGNAARKAARKAVELEPNNADAHVVLGWVLMRDTLGRELDFDHDRAGSLAAYRKARTLDPKHFGAADDLAALLEHNARGVRYGKGADLKAAAEARRASLAIDDSDETANALARVLFFSKSYAEIETLLQKRASSDMRDGLYIAAIAMGRGVNAAIETAGRIRSGSAKQSVLASAGMLSMIARDYDATRKLFAETTLAAPGTPWAGIVNRLKRSSPVAANNPLAPIEDLIGFALDDSYKARFVWDDKTSAEVRANTKAPVAQMQQARMLGPEVLQDLMRAIFTSTVEGSGPWRVGLEAMGQRTAYYAVLEKNVVKLVGSTQQPDGVGRHVFRLLARNDHATATLLLDLLAKDLGGKIRELWKPRDKDAMALVAATIASTSDAANAAPVLARCKTDVADAREMCDEILADIHDDGQKWRELEAHTADWLRRKPDSTKALRTRVRALAKLGRLDDAEKLLAGKPVDDTAWLAAMLSVERSKYDDAVKHLEPLVKRNNAMAANQTAWIALFTKRDLAANLELAAKALGPDKATASTSILNTVAALEAELGHLAAAKADCWQVIERREGARPESADWYVIGRIAEQLGLREDAIAAYRKVTPHPNEPKPISTFHLAQQRLAKLGAK